jgi:hypothetical protein
VVHFNKPSGRAADGMTTRGRQRPESGQRVTLSLRANNPEVCDDPVYRSAGVLVCNARSTRKPMRMCHGVFELRQKLLDRLRIRLPIARKVRLHSMDDVLAGNEWCVSLFKMQ